MVGGGRSEGEGGVERWRRSDKYGGVRLWMALNVLGRILKVDQKPVELPQNRGDVVNRGGYNTALK